MTYKYRQFSQQIHYSIEKNIRLLPNSIMFGKNIHQYIGYNINNLWNEPTVTHILPISTVQPGDPLFHTDFA